MILGLKLGIWPARSRKRVGQGYQRCLRVIVWSATIGVPRAAGVGGYRRDAREVRGVQGDGGHDGRGMAGWEERASDAGIPRQSAREAYFSLIHPQVPQVS